MRTRDRCHCPKADQTVLVHGNKGMKTHTKNLINGIETSRRVGWAKYYALRTENDHLRWLVRLLVKRIVHHNRLPDGDDLVALAKELLKTF